MKKAFWFFISLLLLGGLVALTSHKKSIVEKATFAGGCFWCVQPSFENLPGVVSVFAGYAGGTEPNPTYQDYAKKGYVEAIEITYDPLKVSYDDLLTIFWQQIDPTDAGGQFADRGPGYRPVIFYHTPEQQPIAEHSKNNLNGSQRFSKPVVTEILPAANFYKAEGYHQNYHTKNPVSYKSYRYASGRDSFLKNVWGAQPDVSESVAQPDQTPTDLHKRLTPLQYQVTQQCGTEEPFNNEYWNTKEPGIYVDIVSGEPLFSSLSKFDSGTGWPSFTAPLDPKNVIEIEDRSLFSTRTEVRSKEGNSHLGHVFNDGPLPTGLRYCMNSAALRFIPAKDLEKEGYGAYTYLFPSQN